MSLLMLRDALAELDVDACKVSDFVIELPKYSSMDSGALVSHFLEARDMLKQRIAERRDFLAKAQSWRPSQFPISTMNRRLSTEQRISTYQRAQFLIKCLNKMETRLHEAKIVMATKQLDVYACLLIVCEKLISQPKTLYLSIPNSSVDAAVFVSDQKLYLTVKVLKAAVDEEVAKYHCFPERLFGSSEYNRGFVQKCVDAAMSARKSNSCYFEPLSEEELLYLFFDSEDSPLRALTMEGITTIKEVGKWIDDAVVCLAEYDGICSCKEREKFLRVFAIRYIFLKVFPLLSVGTIQSQEFDRKRALLRNMLPSDLGIEPRYVREDLMDRPVSSLFQQTSINCAPVAWMETSQFMVCPIDIAFCVSKVHESLTIMATLQATEGNSSLANDFFRKIPGFDDIIGLWIAVGAVCDVGNLMGISQFLSDCEHLYEFVPRFVVCRAYLEASILNIENFDV